MDAPTATNPAPSGEPRVEPSRAHFASLPVLVYGSLRKGQSNAGLFARGRGVYGETIRIGGFVLVDGGAFPYAVPTAVEGASIVCEVVALSVERRGEVLDSLAHLEGYRSEAPEASLYLREVVSWSDNHGMRREGFMYVPSEASQARIMRGGHPVIEGGDWLNR